MTSLEMIQTLLEYNYALYDRVWESIMALPDDAPFVADVDYSHGSIRNHMVHVATVDRRWLLGLQGDPNARQYNNNPAGYPTRDTAHALWQRTAQAVQAYAAALDEESLAQVPPGMPGPTWQVLTHLVNHGTDHRAQILRLLHAHSAPTFEQDLILHLWY